MMRTTRSKRGRPYRHYQIQVRTERRDPIDYAALAQAALEQAAMNQRRLEDTTTVPRGTHTDRTPSQPHDAPSDRPSISPPDDEGGPS